MPEEKQNSSPLSGLELFFLLCLGISGFLWLRSPATSTTHLMFRLGLSAVGMVGLIVLLILRFTREK